MEEMPEVILSGTGHNVPRHAIFVFGSNVAGLHGKGAAAFAVKFFDAKYGDFKGPTGRAYAIPIWRRWGRKLPIKLVKYAVAQFIEYARNNLDLEFFVTRIGCVPGGFDEVEIAPLFINAPPNCILPKGWRLYTEQESEDVVYQTPSQEGQQGQADDCDDLQYGSTGKEAGEG